MRKVTAQDQWRHLYRKPYPNAITGIAFGHVVGIGDGSARFAGGVSVICGGNGVGKSTLLDAIRRSLHSGLFTLGTPADAKFSLAVLSADLTLAGTHATAVTDFGRDDPALAVTPRTEITLLDPAAESIAQASLFSQVANLEELLESVSPRIADDHERAMLSFLVGRDYEQCETFEIEDYDGESAVSYFRVTAGGATYGSERMGLGELALHLLHWHLLRVPEQSILLIEEPETYISPRSQGALMDAIAHASLRKSLWVILTTHSPAIAAKVPIEHIRLLSRVAGSSTLLQSPTQAQLQTVLGIPPSYAGIVLVEDTTAREFLLALLSSFAPEMCQRYEIVKSGSVEALINSLRCFPPAGPWLRIAGMLDGDQRKKAHDAGIALTYLPGGASPEELLRQTARANPVGLSKALGKSELDVTVALSETEGAESHDWLNDLAAYLGLRLQTLVPCLVGLWLEADGNSGLAATAVSELRNTLEPR